MATLTATSLEGGRFTPDDKFRLDFDYTGDLHSCVAWVEVISGPTVTHGGGASADTVLHYKAHMRDDGTTDENEDGIIDYSTWEMTLTMSEKGTTICKICTNVLSKTEYDAWKVEHDTWMAENTVLTSESDHDGVVGRMTYIADGNAYFAHDGVSWEDKPKIPGITTYKTGEITMEYEDATPI